MPGLDSAAERTLRRLAVGYVGRNDAEDLYQDAVEDCWRSRDTFDSERGSWLTWASAVLRHRAAKRGRTQLALVPLADLDPAVPVLDVAGDLDLRRAVDRLPTRQREVVILHYYVGLPVAEVAALLDISAGTVKSTLFDARAALARQLEA